MNDDTQQIAKPRERIFQMSVRAWIALIVITTVCAMSAFNIAVEEPLYTLAGMIVAFYYGQNQKQPTVKP